MAAWAAAWAVVMAAWAAAGMAAWAAGMAAWAAGMASWVAGMAAWVAGMAAWAAAMARAMVVMAKVWGGIRRWPSRRLWWAASPLALSDKLALIWAPAPPPGARAISACHTSFPTRSTTRF